MSERVPAFLRERGYRSALACARVLGINYSSFLREFHNGAYDGCYVKFGERRFFHLDTLRDRLYNLSLTNGRNLRPPKKQRQ